MKVLKQKSSVTTYLYSNEKDEAITESQRRIKYLAINYVFNKVYEEDFTKNKSAIRKRA